MPRLERTLVLPTIASSAFAACQAAASSDGWKLVRQAEDHLSLKGRWNPMGTSWPVKVEVSILDGDDGRTDITLEGRIGGLGPVQQRHLEEQLGSLEAAIRSAASATLSPGETELVITESLPAGLDRLDQTVAAYSTVLPTLSKQARTSLDQIGVVLEQGERLIALALASVKGEGQRILALTNKVLVLANARNVTDAFTIDPADWHIESFQTGAMWGRVARLRSSTSGDELVLRSISPSAEAVRILTAFEWVVPGERFRGLAEGFPRDPGSPPIAALWELAVYRDRMIDQEGNHLPFDGEVQAMADAAGNIAVTRGRNLAAKGVGTLALGPVGLFFVGNAKNRQVDNRELYLLVEGSRWAYTHKFNPNLGAPLRAFAQQINVAAREYRDSVEQDEEAPASTPRGSGLARELRELASLRDDGILTEDEFQAQKRRLLEQ
jgi:hypothetical protein